MLNGRKTLVYSMLGIMLSLMVSSVLYFGVYPVTSKIVPDDTLGRDLVITGDVRFIIDFASEYPEAIMLNGDDQVTFKSGVSTDPTDTLDSAEWVGNTYFLGVTSKGGNSIHVIMEFYLAGSTNENGDIYAIRIVAKTSPHPTDSSWRLDSSGIDDPNGPANRVSAQMTNTNLLGGEPRILAGDMTEVSYLGKSGYSVAVSSEKSDLGQTSYFAWTLGLNTAADERTEAWGVYMLLLTVPHQQTLHIDYFRFEGNVWRSGSSSVEHLWAAIKDIEINYYS